MANLNVTPSTFSSALLSAPSGSTIVLGDGYYGDISVRRRVFSSPVVITPAVGAAPEIRSVSVSESDGVLLRGLNIRFTPDRATMDASAVVYVNKSKNVTLSECEVTSGPAVNGVPEAATALDSSGNVLGWPTCHGVTVMSSEDVRIEACELHHLFRGVAAGLSKRVSIVGNEIHHLRKSAIVGGCDDFLIDGNRLHSARPWRYGQTPVGDHGDWIAVWNGATTPLRNITITNNLMRTGDGVPMMGGWVQGKAGGIENLVYAGNAILGGDHMGFSLSDVRGGRIERNVMIQDLIGAKDIGISISDGCSNVVARANVVGSISDKANGSTGNTISDTTIAQRSKASSPGYVTPETLATALEATTPDLVYRLVTGEDSLPEAPDDDLVRMLARHTVAKIEPLKTKGRVIIDFTTPSESAAVLAAVQALKHNR